MSEPHFDNEIDAVNARFDSVLDTTFSNPNLIVQAVQAILQGYGINLPNLLASSSEEYVFRLDTPDEDADLYLYIVIDKSETGFEGYAQIVDSDELEELQNIDDDDDIDGTLDADLDEESNVENDGEVEKKEEKPTTSRFLRQVRHSADD